MSNTKTKYRLAWMEPNHEHVVVCKRPHPAGSSYSGGASRTFDWWMTTEDGWQASSDTLEEAEGLLAQHLRHTHGFDHIEPRLF